MVTRIIDLPVLVCACLNQIVSFAILYRLQKVKGGVQRMRSNPMLTFDPTFPRRSNQNWFQKKKKKKQGLVILHTKIKEFPYD